jgi:hypothetical protein
MYHLEDKARIEAFIDVIVVVVQLTNEFGQLAYSIVGRESFE